MCYRRGSLLRARTDSVERLEALAARGTVELRLDSVVTTIRPGAVDLTSGDAETDTLAVDDVLVLAGGTAPFVLLRRAGVSFDAARTLPPAPSRRLAYPGTTRAH